MTVDIFLNSDPIATQKVDDTSKRQTYGEKFLFHELQLQNTLNIQKKGKGVLYYDLVLQYYMPSFEILPRDEGFTVQKEYYDYEKYKTIAAAKKEEWVQYVAGEIQYDELHYPKSVLAYLTPVTKKNVGDVLLVYNRIITSETRDQVAFDGYIPAGATLVNPNLATSTRTTVETIGSNGG